MSTLLALLVRTRGSSVEGDGHVHRHRPVGVVAVALLLVVLVALGVDEGVKVGVGVGAAVLAADMAMGPMRLTGSPKSLALSLPSIATSTSCEAATLGLILAGVSVACTVPPSNAEAEDVKRSCWLPEDLSLQLRSTPAERVDDRVVPRLRHLHRLRLRLLQGLPAVRPLSALLLALPKDVLLSLGSGPTERVVTHAPRVHHLHRLRLVL